MSLTSYQAAPPCNNGRVNVLWVGGAVNAFPYLSLTRISAVPWLGSSRARVTEDCRKVLDADQNQPSVQLRREDVALLVKLCVYGELRRVSQRDHPADLQSGDRVGEEHVADLRSRRLLRLVGRSCSWSCQRCLPRVFSFVDASMMAGIRNGFHCGSKGAGLIR